MFSASVKRTQYPVGHGGFHAGCIELIDDRQPTSSAAHENPFQKFWYVYDCGSEHAAALKSALASYRTASEGQTNLLFVSHLHSDHINGIEKLQAQAPAQTVIVPYLDVVERLLFVLSDIASGAISSSALAYFADPVGWWAERRATRVIFLEPSNQDDGPPGAPGGPDAPVPGGDRPDGSEATARAQKEPRARLATYFRQPRGSLPAGIKTPDVHERDIGDGSYLIGAGSSLQLEWQRDPRDAWRITDWVLLPYVHPLDKTTRAKFRAALRRLLKTRTNNEEKLTKILLEHLTSHAKTKALLDLYADHFGHDHNALSMSLYSGPLCHRVTARDDRDDWKWIWHADLKFGRYGDWFSDGPVGWLGTGDAALKQSARREPWLQFFKPFASDVLVLTLPHHGSAHNFHEDILAFERMKVALATTVERRRRVAGLLATLGTVEDHEIYGWTVDDKSSNRFSIYCQRQME